MYRKEHKEILDDLHGRKLEKEKEREIENQLRQVGLK